MAVFAVIAVFAVLFVVMLCDVVCQANRAYHVLLATCEFIKFMDILDKFSIKYIKQYLFLSENIESCEIKMTKNPKEQFIELMIENVKANGLDETTARIAAILFIEQEDISLEELAKKTGYSLSSTSTSLKFMEATGLVHKFKKPHSKKIYIKMENNIMEIMLNMLKKKQQYIIGRAKESLPGIINEYKKTKSSKHELKIIEKYYNDVLLGEQIIGEMIKRIEKIRGQK